MSRVEKLKQRVVGPIKEQYGKRTPKRIKELVGIAGKGGSKLRENIKTRAPRGKAIVAAGLRRVTPFQAPRIRRKKGKGRKRRK